MPELQTILLILGATVLGVGGGFFLTRLLKGGSASVDPGVRSAESEARTILDTARRESERIVKDGELRAKEDAFRRREEIVQELEKSRADLREHERRLEKREDGLTDKQKDLSRKEQQLEVIQKKTAEKIVTIDKKGKELDLLIEEETRKLQHIVGLSRENAEKLLMDRLERQLSGEVAARLQQHERFIKQSADSKARDIVLTVIQRNASEYTSHATVSTVDIPSDDVKGRIIGREGRNIRTFEKCTGVDVIVDDTPGVVIVSAFDNVRRETARLALAKLIADGRIHPTRIEEVVAETQREMEQHIFEAGRQAVLDADVAMPSEKLLYLLGRLKFRTSYSQNVLNHSIEVAHLCGMMASELGLDPKIARRCGLLHDVGKAADHEMEGGHPKVGAELAKRYGETGKEVLHAIIGHHDDISIDNPYTVLVASADAISASRPGARRESLEKYVKRLENLEAVACGFPEVEAAFAIQAGRELRVIASSHRTSDADALRVCREIARAIEQQLDYPGEIKVTVIRETRSTEMAR